MYECCEEAATAQPHVPQHKVSDVFVFGACMVPSGGRSFGHETDDRSEGAREGSILRQVVPDISVALHRGSHVE